MEGISGLYGGMHYTIVRDVLSYGAYFYTYEMMQRFLGTKKRQAKQGNTARVWMEKAIAGGLAGQVFWTISYPFDVISSIRFGKSFKIIKDGVKYTKFAGEDKAYPYDKIGMYKRCKSLFNQYGPYRFYRGFLPCFIRAFPASAILFTTYEFVLENIDPILDNNVI